MNNDSAKTCWEFWNCPKESRENCPARLIELGKACWMFVSGMRPRLERGFKRCWECPWFKKPDIKK